MVNLLSLFYLSETLRLFSAYILNYLTKTVKNQAKKADFSKIKVNLIG